MRRKAVVWAPPLINDRRFCPELAPGAGRISHHREGAEYYLPPCDPLTRAGENGKRKCSLVPVGCLELPRIAPGNVQRVTGYALLCNYLFWGVTNYSGV